MLGQGRQVEVLGATLRMSLEGSLYELAGQIQLSMPLEPGGEMRPAGQPVHQDSLPLTYWLALQVTDVTVFPSSSCAKPDEADATIICAKPKSTTETKTTTGPRILFEHENDNSLMSRHQRMSFRHGRSQIQNRPQRYCRGGGINCSSSATRGKPSSRTGAGCYSPSSSNRKWLLKSKVLVLYCRTPHTQSQNSNDVTRQAQHSAWGRHAQNFRGPLNERCELKNRKNMISDLIRIFVGCCLTRRCVVLLAWM